MSQSATDQSSPPVSEDGGNAQAVHASDVATSLIPLNFQFYSEAEMLDRAVAFHMLMSKRRTVRHFSEEPVPQAVIEACLQSASTAPSGANMQPWHFVVVGDPEIKQRIRIAAEIEERAFYDHRAPEEWLTAVRRLGTDSNKPFLEAAPYLIAIFAQRYHLDANEQQVKHYYVSESVGIATGMLIAACHNAGLATLTHTPSPMGFLNKILERPDYERPFLLLVVGYPTKDAAVPDIRRKTLDEFATFV
ncbi:MAG: nitroreductase family protein, partial [Caldilineaceae bacterium]|nr:nitroreductase family protein [Caldilineaceae bacterium]